MASNKKDKNKTKNTDKVKILDTIGIYKDIGDKKKIGTYKKNDSVKYTTTKSDKKGNTWAKTDKGWIMIHNKQKNKQYASVITTTGGSSFASSDQKNLPYIEANKAYSKKEEAWKENNSLGNIKVNTTLTAADMGKHGAIKETMQLFGIPYQFLNSVDARIDDMSTVLGRKFIENFILNAPVVTFIPGVPTYLPGSKDKTSMTEAFLQASTGNLGPLQQMQADGNLDNVRLYDFKSAYTKYFQYTNILCRTIATFMEIDGNEKDEKYKINNEYPNFLSYDWKNYRWNGKGYHSAVANAASSAYESASRLATGAGSLLNDVVQAGSNAWTYIAGNSEEENLKNLSLTITDYKSNSYYLGLTDKQKKNVDAIVNAGKTKNTPKTKKEQKAAKKKEEEAMKKASNQIKAYVGENKKTSKNQLNLDDDSVTLSEDEESIIETLGRKEHFIQFYADPNGTNYSRSISNNTQESMLKSAMDSGTSSVRDIQFMTNTGGMSSDKLQKLGTSMVESIGSALGNVVGDDGTGLASRLTKFAGNVILGETMIMPQIYSGSSQDNNITVTIPLKCIYGNKYSMCMDFLFPLMHIIALAYPQATSANTFSAPFLVKCFMKGVFTCNLGIITGISVQYSDNFNDDGLYMGATVSLTIQDLYPDISMTPSSDPVTFVNNSSLIEYLATKCGLNLLESQFSTKIDLLINTLENFIPDKADSIVSSITERMDMIVQSLTGL